MAYDGIRAADYAENHANPYSKGECGKYVREAIEWGGISLSPTRSAKDYWRSLEAAGFYAVTGPSRKGDVAVIQPAPGHQHGHMAIYNGAVWISDFRQRAGEQGFYPGEAYRKAKPPYTIYRHD